MLEYKHFRFLGKCGQRELLLVRNRVSHVGLSFRPVVDTAKLLRLVRTRFEVVMSIVHGNQEPWGKPAADGRERTLLGLAIRALQRPDKAGRTPFRSALHELHEFTLISQNDP